ncbi:cupin domain-containing protein [Uliginosibacterium sp. H1]|uniref:cupin domain-containing protein n=1 Tax=Uliginosibacterium sp. H1 TaxID=3114757 RepID=UPI002E189AF0|nr:cupin domain-containing protein [Uliginosibacterium sp. H1]
MSAKPRIVFNATTPEYYFAEGCHITEWWNSPDDAAASVARARVPVGVTTHWHSLRDTTERYVILEGRGVVEAGKLPPMPVSAGDVVVIPAGEPQRIRNDGQGDLVFLAICTPRFLTDNYQALE